MLSADEVRAHLLRLYRKDPNIHVDLALQRARPALVNVPARITHLFPHVFQIEESSGGFLRNHTLQYADVIVKRVVIHELEQVGE